MVALSDYNHDNLPGDIGEIVWASNENFRLAIAPEVGGRITGLWHNTPRGWCAILHPLFRDKMTGRLLAGCLPLVPYSNRIANAVFTFDGTEYTLTPHPVSKPHSLHGIGWDCKWQVTRSDPTCIEIRLYHREPDDRWPWSFKVTQRFVVSDVGLQCSMSFTNTSGRVQPCGIGFHPAFVRNAQTQLQFNASGFWEADETGIPTRLKDTNQTSYDFSGLRDLPEGTIDTGFEDWRGSAIIADVKTNNNISVTSESCNRMVLFAPRGHDFICVEPVTNKTNAFNDRYPIKSGVTLVNAGDNFAIDMRIEVSRTDQVD